ncbi:MAG: ABC transporter permease [Planctomycetota bacterium]
MGPVFRLAVKDIKLLLRDKLGAFFIIGFPILMGVFFGLVMGGASSGSRGKMRIAVVDLDDSEMSKKFVASLRTNDSVEVETAELEAAKESVRKGQRVGLIVVPEKFGETAGILWETPPTLQLGMDPSRTAESAMLQGFVMESMGGLIGERFNNPKQFRPFVADSLKQIEESEDVGFLQQQALKTLFGSVDDVLESLETVQENQKNEGGEGAGDDSAIAGPGFQMADFESIDITRQLDPSSPQAQAKKMRSKWDISFPQAMMWGVLACCAGFAISIARENTMGTMLRLQAAPISRFQILLGKALACFLTVIGVIAFMLVLGILMGMDPLSFPKLGLAAGCVAFCFVGIMMTMAVLGKTEQSVNGIGWAINMVMAMFGGGMIPVMFMPGFMQSLSVISPVKWSILSVEGAIWRDFSYAELAVPCGILIAVGMTGMLFGSVVLNRRSA